MKISLRALTFAYRFTPGGSATLKDLDLEFDSTEAIGLLGQVGSGKSTVLKILAGAITSGKGMMRVDDAPFAPAAYINTTTGERPWWCRMAYVAQRPEDQLVGRTVEQEIAYGLRNLRNQEEQATQYNNRRGVLSEMRTTGFRLSTLRRLREEQVADEALQRERKAVQKSEIAARVSDVLHGAGLDPDIFRTRGLDELSRGEKRRVALAAALALDPDMLLLDESLSNIDPAGHDSLIATIQHARTATHCGMVASSHRIEDILPFVERIIFLTNGSIAWDGPTGRFLEGWAAAWSDPTAPNADLFATLNVPPLLETLFRLRAGGLEVPLSAAIVTAPELAAQVVAETMARHGQEVRADG